MKLTIITYSYNKEKDLIIPLINNIKRATGSEMIEKIIVVNEANEKANASFSDEFINELNSISLVQVVNSFSDRNKNLRSMDFIKESVNLMKIHAETSDFIIKLDPDTVPISFTNMIQPMVDDLNIVANFVPSRKENDYYNQFGMGYCYAIKSSLLEMINSKISSIDSFTMDMAVDYLKTSSPNSIRYNFPIRENMFISRVAANLGDVVYKIQGSCFSLNKKDIFDIKQDKDIVLLDPAVINDGRNRAAKIAEAISMSINPNIADTTSTDDQTIIIGIGTGRSGTKYTSQLLSFQPSTTVEHEMVKRIPFELKVDIDTYIKKIQSLNPKSKYVGDCAFYLTRLAEQFLEYSTENNINLKVIAVKREKEKIINSYSTIIEQSEIDHFCLNGKYGIYSVAYPKFELPTCQERVGMFVDYVNQIIDDIYQKYPDKVYVTNIDNLNTKTGVNQMFDFLGMKKSSRRYDIVGDIINEIPV